MDGTILFISFLFELPEAIVRWIEHTIAILAILMSSILLLLLCKYSLKTLRTIFYFLLFIVFRGRFPYLKLISYTLSYSVFAISMLIIIIIIIPVKIIWEMNRQWTK